MTVVNLDMRSISNPGMLAKITRVNATHPINGIQVRFFQDQQGTIALLDLKPGCRLHERRWGLRACGILAWLKIFVLHKMQNETWLL